MNTGNALLEKWSYAHTSFNEVENVLSAKKSIHAGAQEEFFEQALSRSPNGDLYYHSSFLHELANNAKIYLGHITLQLEDIKRNGAIYSSGGCLVGSTYCFPFTKENSSSFRFHNLGEYIFQTEAAGRSNGAAKVVLFEVDLPASSHNNLLGINYLKLGAIHFDLFSELKYLLSSRELFELQHTVEKNITQALPFFKLCCDMWLEGTMVEPCVFFHAINKSIPHIPVLGYMYFEIIAEYLMLYSDSVGARQARDNKEIYNVPYKKMVYDLHPEYRQNFRLNDFNPTLGEISKYISKAGFIQSFASRHFAHYVVNRMVQLVNQLLISDTEKKQIFTNNTWSFEQIEILFKPLVGHMIHRELRSFGRYPDFYFYYDQLKALQVWNYWNHMGIVIPFNGVFPKGEVGINPASSELKCRSFVCTTRWRDGNLYAEPNEELAVSLTPRLIDLKYTLLRSKPSSV